MSEVKTIYRVFKDRNFTQINNGLLYDNRLTLKAKGLICIMLSLPDTWDFRRSHLLKLSHDGKDSLKSAIDEGKKLGYITVNSERDKRGRIVKWIMSVYETPTSPAPQEVHPEAGFPLLDFPLVENPPVSNTQEPINTKTTTNTVVDELNDKAAKLGIKTIGGAISALVMTYGPEKVSEKLKMLESNPRVRNPSGWLQDALDKNYQESNRSSYKGRIQTEPLRNFVTIEETEALLKEQATWKRSSRETARQALADMKKNRIIDPTTH